MDSNSGNNNNNNNNYKNNKRKSIATTVAIILGTVLLYLLVFSGFSTSSVTEVTYSAFLDAVDKGQVTEVSLEQEENYILFTMRDSATGKETVCRTGTFPDESLSARLIEKGVTFSAVIPTEISSLLSSIISWVLPFVMMIVFWRVISSVIIKKGGAGGLGGMMNIGKSNARVYTAGTSSVTFKDVAGQEEAKEALSEIVDYLHDTHRYTDIGAKIPTGALLVGPPGTGKTLLAKAVANEAGVPFFSVSGSEFVEMYVGMGAARIRDLFKQANEKAPCIVFIDEIDTIGKKRDGVGFAGNDEREQTLNQLLTEMDGFDGKKGIVLLAATNRPDSLDPALLRPGRFDRRVPVQLPDLRGRIDILRVHLARVKHENGIDLSAVARATSMASGADLANIVNEAALRAVRMKRSLVTQSDLEECVENVLAGTRRRNAILSDDEKRTVAFHEIGHALVAHYTNGSAPVSKISIIPRTSGALGYTMQVDETEKTLLTKEELLSRIRTLTAGQAAEQLIFGRVTTGASNDIEQATRLARAMVTQYGMSDTFGMFAPRGQSTAFGGGDASLVCADATMEKVDGEAARIISDCRADATQILMENRLALCQIASYLTEKETLTGDEFTYLLSAIRPKLEDADNTSKPDA